MECQPSTGWTGTGSKSNVSSRPPGARRWTVTPDQSGLLEQRQRHFHGGSVRVVLPDQVAGASAVVPSGNVRTADASS
jgi:hypothetical protein